MKTHFVAVIRIQWDIITLLKETKFEFSKSYEVEHITKGSIKTVNIQDNSKISRFIGRCINFQTHKRVLDKQIYEINIVTSHYYRKLGALLANSGLLAVFNAYICFRDSVSVYEST